MLVTVWKPGVEAEVLRSEIGAQFKKLCDKLSNGQGWGEVRDRGKRVGSTYIFFFF